MHTKMINQEYCRDNGTLCFTYYFTQFCILCIAVVMPTDLFSTTITRHAHIYIWIQALERLYKGSCLFACYTERCTCTSNRERTRLGECSLQLSQPTELQPLYLASKAQRMHPTALRDFYFVVSYLYNIT